MNMLSFFKNKLFKIKCIKLVLQVWVQESGTWIMFREAYPATAMALRYPPLKTRLKCNVRKVGMNILPK